MKILTTNKIKLPIENRELADRLLNKKAILATVLGAGGLLGIVAAKVALSGDIAPTESESDELQIDADSELLIDDVEAEIETDIVDYDAGEVVVPVDIPVVEVSDTTSFGDAFAAAREELGPGGIFSYNGDYYHTYYKEEWDAMHTEQQDQYFTDLDEGADYDDVTYIDADDNVTNISIDNNPEPEVIIEDQDGGSLNDEVLIDTDPSETDANFAGEGHDEDSIEMDADMGDSDPSFDMDEGDFGDLEGVPEVEVVEVDPADFMSEDADNDQDLIDIDEDDLVDPEEVVDVEEDDLGADTTTADDFLDELFDDNLPEVSEEDLEDDDLPDPINDADLEDWGL